MVRRQEEQSQPTSLIHLQHQIKKDPESYKEEYLLQWKHYTAQRDLLYHFDAANPPNEFLEILDFLGHVSTLYPETSASFIDDLESLAQLEGSMELKQKVLQSLRILRSRNGFPVER